MARNGHNFLRRKSPSRAFRDVFSVSKGFFPVLSRVFRPETVIFLSEKGFSVAKKGFSVTKKGFSVTKKGFSVTKKGFSVAKKGFSVAEKGFSVAKKAFSVAEKGTGAADQTLSFLIRCLLPITQPDFPCQKYPSLGTVSMPRASRCAGTVQF